MSKNTQRLGKVSDVFTSKNTLRVKLQYIVTSLLQKNTVIQYYVEDDSEGNRMSRYTVGISSH